MSVLELFKLDGKAAIVTGASRGLGRGIAIALADAGADVAIVGRGDLGETQLTIEATGRKCAAIHADLAQRDAVPQIIERTLSAFGGLDILVNNAGIIRRGSVLEFSEKDWDDVIQVNEHAVFFLSQAAARVMVKQNEQAATPGISAGTPMPRHGRIINIASMLSFQGGIRVGSYTAAKSAVLGITRLMANELAAHGITVNAIAPGYMATDNTAPLRADEKRNADILARIPAGRWGTPDDLHGAVVFLASAASAYVTGTTLAVDGGWLAR